VKPCLKTFRYFNLSILPNGKDPTEYCERIMPKVTALYVYPVKGLKGISLITADIAGTGKCLGLLDCSCPSQGSKFFREYERTSLVMLF
jgi:hypothetical protein